MIILQNSDMSETNTSSETSTDTEKTSTESGALSDTSAPARSSRFKKVISASGWITFAIFCLILFTWIKLPDDKIRSYITGMIGTTLAEKGITFRAEETKLSFLWGPSFVMKKITLNPTPPAQAIVLDRIDIAPSLFSLLIGRLGGQIWIYHGDGSLYASFSIRDSDLSAKVKAKSFDIGKSGILPIMVGVKASALVDGTASFSGDITAPNTVDSEIQLHLSSGVIEPQMIYGFAVPRLMISEGVLDAITEKGRGTIRTLRLGKTDVSSNDDLRGSVSGDLVLNKTWDSSTINLKARFSVSENVKKAFILLDALLGTGKQPDGSYAFALAGPTNGVNAVPLKSGE